MKQWRIGRPAVIGSSIAILKCFDTNGRVYSHIHYQDPKLYLRVREWYYDSSTHQWALGEQVAKRYLSRTNEDHIVVGFELGRQPSRTPITADVVYSGQVDINVTCRDAQGCAMSTSWSKGSKRQAGIFQAAKRRGGMGGVEQVSRRMFSLKYFRFLS